MPPLFLNSVNDATQHRIYVSLALKIKKEDEKHTTTTI
jgi:hypothetical protein